MTKSSSEPGAWRKLGQVAIEPPAAPWFATHAALPVIERPHGNGWRVQFSVRDAAGRSHIAQGSFTTTPGSAGTVAVDAHPALAPGELGTFDDSGVTSSCLVRHGGRRFLYYTGWSRGVSVPFYLFAGLAVSESDDGPFARLSPAPLLERDAVDPILTASPWVLIEDGVWRMWYVSGVRWEARREGARHYYHVRYAESADGMRWRREGRVCLDFSAPGEFAFGRPCVVRHGGGYQMWYSHRGAAYRIGYAESHNGIEWRRRDDRAGIDVSPSGWDAGMIEYPVVFRDAASEYMLYNGNDYGRTGMGLAARTP